MIEWSVAERPFPGQLESGDLAVVEVHPPAALIAAIDGLGHGPEAAVAARAAAATLRAGPVAPPDRLIERCHAQLRSTRGAAMSVVTLEAGRLHWCGIGNVEAVLLKSQRSAKESLVMRGGVVGGHLPPMHVSSHDVDPGDVLILATDGIASRFTDGLTALGTPPQIAEDLLARFYRGTDDALVLVARIVST